MRVPGQPNKPLPPVLEADLMPAAAEPSLAMAGTGQGLQRGFTPPGHYS